MSGTNYRILADGIASDIAEGLLKPGDRLPPQRKFAYEKRVAVSTAGRVYAELLRRGLIVGEVGRGTFVSDASSRTLFHGGIPQDEHIDLAYNYPTIPEQAGFIARALAALQRPGVAGAATGLVTSRQVRAASKAVAAFMETPQWRPQENGLVFTGSGLQSIAVALAALTPVGGRIAAEAVSYPGVKGIATRLGASVVPIAMDAQGLIPDALEKAHRRAALSAIYLQPIVHNPIGVSMGLDRRASILRVASKIGVTIVEDFVYGFLSDMPPLAAIAPEQCIVVDSLSKRIAPGLSVGILHVPRRLRDRVMSIVCDGMYTIQPLAMDIGVRMLLDGTALAIARLKRQDARLRQSMMRKILAPFEIEADPGSYHLWLKLPEGWRSEAFTAAAAYAGVGVSPSGEFTMTPAHTPRAVRLALGRPTHDELRIAGERLARLLKRRPKELDQTG